MEYPKNNRSGTDDDLSNHGIIRASKGLSCSENMTKDLRDMEFQIHRIEIEAYSAVLRAFIAQADSISWGKEGLISGLRKELRVSDVEHREILGKVKFDDSIKSIRESHKIAEAQLTTMSPPPFGPNSMGLVPHKKLKRGHLTVSSSAKYLNYSQSSQATIPPPTTHDRDNQWGSKGSLLSSQVNVGQDLVPDNQNLQPSTMKARGSLIVHSSKKGFVHSGTENLRTGIDVIKICPTDKLIYEIERVCGGENPDPALIQRAKLILKDHEKALLEAIGKLADVSDDGSPDQTRKPYSSQEPQRRAHVYQNPVYNV